MSSATPADPWIPPRAGERFRSVYVAVDGSDDASAATALAATIAARSGGRLIATHAFAARLHEHRFRQMEGGLPEKYRQEDEIQRQREIHAGLITRGLRLISDSYLDGAQRIVEERGAPFERRSVEGRNWQALLEDVAQVRPDVVVVGALGLGADGGAHVGTTCERLVRRLAIDALVVRSASREPLARIGVAIDGSEASLGALVSAIALAMETGSRMELVSSFDPHFHHHVFRVIADVLSEEAGRIFRLEEQRRLHEEIIDRGLDRIYRGHLETAGRMVAAAGISDFGTELLTGKAPACLARFVKERAIGTFFLGRTGAHAVPALDLGSCPEALLRQDVACNVFLSARTAPTDLRWRHEEPLAWTEAATRRIQRVPAFVRALAIGAVERRARETDQSIVTSEIIDEVTRAVHGGAAARPAEAPNPDGADPR